MYEDGWWKLTQSRTVSVQEMWSGLLYFPDDPGVFMCLKLNRLPLLHVFLNSGLSGRNWLFDYFPGTLPAMNTVVFCLKYCDQDLRNTELISPNSPLKSLTRHQRRSLNFYSVICCCCSLLQHLQQILVEKYHILHYFIYLLACKLTN